MNYRVDYKVRNLMNTPELGSCSLGGEIGARFDRFIYERVSGRFAVEEILKEAEDFFKTQYDDIYPVGYWRSEFWGKLMLSAVRCAKYKKDERLKENIRKSCYKMLSFQRDDGYLSAYGDSDNIYAADGKDSASYIGWSADWCWNIWGMKYTLWGLLEAADLLDDVFILAGAVKLCDWIIAKLEKDGKKLTDTGVMNGMASGSILKPMLLLYRFTADEKYLDFCKDTVKEWMRDDGKCPNIINNAFSGKSVGDWYDVNNGWYPKAYEMTSCFDGMVELYRITGDKVLFDAAKALYDILIKYESNILGSVGYCERYHNAASYADAATEICDVIHWMRLCHELYKLTGEIKYMESFEKAFANAFLAGVYEDGKGSAFFVRGAGRHWTAIPQCESKYQHCCTNNVGRGFANAAESCVFEGDDGYYVNMYVQSSTKFGDTEIVVGANYFDIGWVGVAVRNSEKGKKLYLRIPEWSKNTKIRVGVGEEFPVDCGKYFELELGEGTTFLKMRFDMTPEVIKMNWEPIPEGDYHLIRWIDGADGLCDRSCMLHISKVVIRRGPVILTRSKKIGAKEDDMFSNETLYGKNITSVAAQYTCNNTTNLVAARVTVVADGEEYKYVMCDYASGSNIDSHDPKYFSIYL